MSITETTTVGYYLVIFGGFPDLGSRYAYNYWSFGCHQDGDSQSDSSLTPACVLKRLAQQGFTGTLTQNCKIGMVPDQ